jgi:NADPH2:quinone reductase
MKAVLQSQGGFSLAEIEPPRPGNEDVLVRVRASALNRADLAMLTGHKHGDLGGAGTVLGLEWSGEVVEVGANVAGLKPGDRVMGSGKGAFAEYAVADYGRVMAIPRPEMSYEQAACLPVALQTMHNAVVTHGHVGQDHTVLIQGASSGVGLMGLQIARLMGARMVIGTSTTMARRTRLQEYGAHAALDSGADDWVNQVLELTGGRGVESVIDMLSGAVMNRNMQATAIGGRIVNVGRLAGKETGFDFDLHALRRISYIGVTFRTRTAAEVREINRRMTEDLWPALAAGKLTLPIDQAFPFEDVGQAYERMKSNSHFGKIVLALA